MRRLTFLTLLFVACGHERLDFKLPDAGHNDRAAGTGSGSANSVGCAGSDLACRDFLNPADLNPAELGQRWLDAGSASSMPATAAGAGGSSSSSAPDQGVMQTEQYQDDPRGYPTGPGQLAEPCAHGQSFDEVCANNIDDDCDGTVDEYPGIGAPCSGLCRNGIYACSASSNALFCLDAQGCMNTVPASCGDGFVGNDEACDPNVASEQAGITCTLTCERPLFIRCVEAGTAHPERCDALHVCDQRIGACMPVIGPQQPRCPQLRIEGSAAEDQFYPMLEMENGECWITCSESEQCPSSLSECYMGFCAVPF